ncbi:MAG: PAS domain S-box protein, partial [Deltaproteobacteria bacterium]|nr:PAS domain S-box protein [Deltaproteobacteria bacterium]
LFNNMSDFILIHDLNGIIMDVNPAAVKASGYSHDELIGRPVSDFMPPDLKSPFFHEYLPNIATHGRKDGVFIFIFKDMTHHYTEFRNVLQAGDDGIPYVICSSRDVTERVTAQREFRRMEEELAHAQKMEAVGTLASGISHDFNNFLQAISGYVQLMLSRDIQDQEIRRCLKEMDLATERAAELVQRLLLFGRKVKPELKPMDLNSQIRLTTALLRRTIPRMIEIVTNL